MKKKTFGGKVVKKAEGGDVENENGPEASSRANAARMESYKKTVADTPASSDEGMSRGQAFRAARAAGKPTFMYAGKKYTTELASAAKPSTTVSGVEVVGKKPSTTVSEIEVVGTKPRTAALRNIRAAMMGTGYDPKTSAMKKGGKVTKSTKGGSAQKKGTDMKKMASGGMKKKMASGGSFRSSAVGIATKGKTKAKQVKMARGGSMKGCS